MKMQKCAEDAGGKRAAASLKRWEGGEEGHERQGSASPGEEAGRPVIRSEAARNKRHKTFLSNLALLAASYVELCTLWETPCRLQMHPVQTRCWSYGVLRVCACILSAWEPVSFHCTFLINLICCCDITNAMCLLWNSFVHIVLCAVRLKLIIIFILCRSTK